MKVLHFLYDKEKGLIHGPVSLAILWTTFKVPYTTVVENK